MMLGLARNVRARAGISAARASIPTCASLSRRGLLLAPTYDRYIPLPSHEGPQFDAILVGAGFAMFGSPEGPWNMARRAEVKLGPRLKVAAVIDPANPPTRAQAALAEKSKLFVADSYANTEILPSIAAYAEKVKAGHAPVPKAIFVASPPQFRGGLEPYNDLEIQINKYFPNAAIMVEKPVATGTPWLESVGQAKEVGHTLETRHNGVVAVGYCLRYLKLVQKMKDIIDENNLTVMATFGRYIMAYELAVKTEWWRNSVCQGPIIENGTHLADLSRYFGGDVDLETLYAHAIEADEKPGQLSKKNFDDDSIPMEDKIPRVTSANWKYKSGAVGSLLHGTVLHGVDYSIELEVYCDGYQMILQDPYGSPSLAVRRPGSDKHEITPLDDDPYTTEVSNFIDAIDGGPDPRILSTYEDAAKSYEFTWAIRRASETSTRKRRAKIPTT